MAELDSVSVGMHLSEQDRSRCKKYYEGWIEHKLPSGKTWNNLWLSLRGNIIFIFDSNDTSNPHTMKGQLNLSPDTDVQVVTDNKSKKNKGFQFDLFTSGSGGQRKTNRFKCGSVGERDLWIAYILGLGTGYIPDGLHLLPGQRQDILLAIQEVHRVPTGAVPSIPPGHPAVMRRTSQNSLGTNSSGSRSDGSGTVTSAPFACHIPRPSYDSGRPSYDTGQGVLKPSMNFSPPPNSPEVQLTSDLENPVFFTDPRRCREVPFWFFGSCSREKAEAVLAEHSNYGNVLMRESTDYLETGTFVISLRRVVQGGAQINHYEVNRTNYGYVINVDNPHRALACLSDVMDYFVSEAGPTTRPMTRNDFDDVDYDLSMSRSDISMFDPHIDRAEAERRASAETVRYPHREPSMPTYHAPPPPVPVGRKTSQPDIHRKISQPDIHRFPSHDHFDTSGASHQRVSGISSGSGSSNKSYHSNSSHHSEALSVPVSAGDKIKEKVEQISQELMSKTRLSSQGSWQSDEYVNMDQYRRTAPDYGDSEDDIEYVNTNTLQQKTYPVRDDVYTNQKAPGRPPRTPTSPGSDVSAWGMSSLQMSQPVVPASHQPVAATHQFADPALNNFVARSGNSSSVPGYHDMHSGFHDNGYHDNRSSTDSGYQDMRLGSGWSHGPQHNQIDEQQFAPNLRSQYLKSNTPISPGGMSSPTTPGYADFLMGKPSKPHPPPPEMPSSHPLPPPPPPPSNLPTVPPAARPAPPIGGQSYLSGLVSPPVRSPPTTPPSQAPNFSFGEELASRLKAKRQDIYQSTDQVRYQNY